MKVAHAQATTANPGKPSGKYLARTRNTVNANKRTVTGEANPLDRETGLKQMRTATAAPNSHTRKYKLICNPTNHNPRLRNPTHRIFVCTVLPRNITIIGIKNM